MHCWFLFSITCRTIPQLTIRLNHGVLPMILEWFSIDVICIDVIIHHETTISSIQLSGKISSLVRINSILCVDHLYQNRMLCGNRSKLNIFVFHNYYLFCRPNILSLFFHMSFVHFNALWKMFTNRFCCETRP